MEPQVDNSVAGDAFAFTGTWREYLPIAASNFLLIIVTLGIYRSWAKARERRYLWSRSIFIDDRLEWTGTGREMFVGFLIAVAVAGVPLFLLNLASQALVLRGHVGLAFLVTMALYLLLFTLFGFARFRALRYRLTRTWWHGIRGGSDAKGGAYAWSALWKPLLGSLFFGIMIPWSMISLWNERWNAMSFGPDAFEADATTEGLMSYWVAVILVPIMLFFAAILMGPRIAFLGVVIGYGAYLVLGLVYYAAFYRTAVESLSLGQIRFEFDATTADWFRLIMGDIGLVIGTLGFGLMFLGYRHWSFFMRHLGATGYVDLEDFTQSMTLAPAGAEGFADAFDIGAL